MVPRTGAATCLAFCPIPVISMPATSPETAVARGGQATQSTVEGAAAEEAEEVTLTPLIFCVHP